MYKTKLCLGIGNFDASAEEQIAEFKKAGFDGFFIEWKRGMDMAKIRKTGDENDMYFQSVHAPFVNSKYLWGNYLQTEDSIQELIECVHVCSDVDVPIMVMHAFIGFESHSPNNIGLHNFEKIVKEAERYGVKIAFENTEGEEYLDALMEYFKGCLNVGFCWDTGHELCYNKGRDMLKSYGSRLFCTHINDNLGVKDFNGNITAMDDLHLLPFDGIADWENIAKRLAQHNFQDCLTFELIKKSKPGRHENDIYEKMSLSEYLAEAFKRACRIAALKQKFSN